MYAHDVSETLAVDPSRSARTCVPTLTVRMFPERPTASPPVVWGERAVASIVVGSPASGSVGASEHGIRAETVSASCRIRSNGVYQRLAGVAAGTLRGGHVYVERIASAGPSAPTTAAMNEPAARTSARRVRDAAVTRPGRRTRPPRD